MADCRDKITALDRQIDLLQPQAVEAIMPDQEHQHQREGEGVYYHRPPAARQRSNTESELYSIKRCLEGSTVQRTQGERRGAVRPCRRTGEDLLVLVGYGERR